MNADQINQLSNRIIALLPEDRALAMTIIALTLAKVSKATDTSDDGTMNIVRSALLNVKKNVPMKIVRG